jgi:hypothetical protein
VTCLAEQNDTSSILTSIPFELQKCGLVLIFSISIYVKSDIHVYLRKVITFCAGEGVLNYSCSALKLVIAGSYNITRLLESPYTCNAIID